MKKMKRTKLIIYFFLFIKCLSGETHAKDTAKNAILFIGDGMGLSYITAARLWSKGSKGKLNIEHFPVLGLVKTHSSDNFVTDSAASATALATGQKTYNGSISMSDPNKDLKKKSLPLTTIVDIAKADGKKVGIITTTRVTHATPASFYAHSKSRHLEKDIASQAVNSNIDLLLGGGRKYFYGKSWQDPDEKKKGKQQDNRNLVKEMQSKGWQYLDKASQINSEKKYKLPILGLFNYDHLSYETQRDPKKKQEPTLEELVAFGLKTLSQEKEGYVLIIEGGRIDHAAHANLHKEALGEVIGLDRAIGYVQKNTSKKETLIVVTADHETGGLAINGYGDVDQVKGEKFLGLQKTPSEKKD